LTDSAFFQARLADRDRTSRCPTRYEADGFEKRQNAAADARALVEARACRTSSSAWSIFDGVIRAKYLARDKFFDALEASFKFCDVIFGWDFE